MTGVPPPHVPNPFEDDAQRLERAEANVERGNRLWWMVFAGGFAVLGIWAALAMAGVGGLGLILAPIGLGMIVGSGVQLFIDKISSI